MTYRMYCEYNTAFSCVLSDQTERHAHTKTKVIKFITTVYTTHVNITL